MAWQLKYFLKYFIRLVIELATFGAASTKAQECQVISKGEGGRYEAIVVVIDS